MGTDFFFFKGEGAVGEKRKMEGKWVLKED